MLHILPTKHLPPLPKMATSARLFQTVKPHIPLIKFPSRTREAATTLTQTMSAPKPTSQAMPQPSQSKTQAPSVQDLDFLSLPEKYQRKPISPEEMAYIERGGPE